MGPPRRLGKVLGMDQADGSRAGSKTAAPGAPQHLRWDTAEMQSHSCSIATASATPTAVVLNFGERRSREDEARVVSAELLRSIALSPLTAKNLAATLRRLIDEHDGRSR
jgi:hypothetical protein